MYAWVAVNALAMVVLGYLYRSVDAAVGLLLMMGPLLAFLAGTVVAALLTRVRS